MVKSDAERQIYILAVFALAALALIYKAFDIQVIDDSYRLRADAISSGTRVIYPSRGGIYDKKNTLLVNNNLMYDLLVTYNQVDEKMDTAKFCKLLEIDKEYFISALSKNFRSNQFSKRVPFVFLNNISPQVYTRFKENLYNFPGFFTRQRVVRKYPFANAAHLLGSIREVNAKELKDSLKIYRRQDYIGASGLEKQYEYNLRGKKGMRKILKNSLGREVESYLDGEQDIPPESGKNIVTTIDIDLQKYAEELLQNKAGSVVAIDPRTGGILCMVTAPGFDPNLLSIGNNRGAAFDSLRNNPNKPFINRATSAQYPPGSLFKSVVALIALQEKVLDPNRTIYCNGAYMFKGTAYTGCHGHPTCFNVASAIQHSCNSYFVTVFREVIDQYGGNSPREGLATFNSYLDKFGLGRRLGIDFPTEKRGNYLRLSDIDKLYKDEQAWYSIWLRSLGIGQGELLMTNIQMANLAAIIANKGYYLQPHLVDKITDSEGKTIEKNEFKRNYVGVDSSHFKPIIEGMHGAVTSGTATAAYIWDLPICGKTGTAENNQGNKKDHSIFFAFAPKEKPEIAIVVYVENAGFGGTYAVPIASLLIEKHLKGKISPYRNYLEKRMLTTSLIEKPIVIPDTTRQSQ